MSSDHPDERPAKKPRKSRGRGLRTNAGCVVCRKRHVKCDEVKPICAACARGKRICVWHNQEISSDADILSEDIVTTQPTQRSLSAATIPQLPASEPRHEPEFNSEAEGTGGCEPVQDNPGYEDGQLTNPAPAAATAVSPDQMWNTHSPAENVASPQYTPGSNAPINEATSRWFGLLANDADGFDAFSIGTQLPDLNNHTPASITGPLASYESFNQPSRSVGTRAPTPIGPTDGEHAYWKWPQNPTANEIQIFDHFVEQFSSWLDLHDPWKHFSSTVPHLALNNEGLFKAILALSSRHLSLMAGGSTIDHTASVQYYSDTLRYLQDAMRYHTFTRSLELLSTSLILSQYEMLDGASGGWARHLKGVFWIQRSLNADGQSGGLKQAVWWNWLRQDIWAAYREQRRCWSFYQPTRSYAEMSAFDVADRATYLLSQCVNYASKEEVVLGEANLQLRVQRAVHLSQLLNEWRANLPQQFSSLPTPQGDRDETVFKPIKIYPANFSAALQVHHFSCILILIYQPAAGGHLEYKGRQRKLRTAIDAIGGLAMATKVEAAEVVSTQCLYAAGLYTDDLNQRREICRLIERHQSRTRWPNQSLARELKQVEQAEEEGMAGEDPRERAQRVVVG